MELLASVACASVYSLIERMVLSYALRNSEGGS